jgi:flagellar protein FlaG
MDVEFSQVGQNVALSVAEQGKVQLENTEKELSALGQSAKDVLQSVKVADILVDTDKEVNSTSGSSDSIETAVAEVSDFVQARNRQLDFSIDEKSQRSVVKVTDSESGDVIRQIPSEEVLALSERIRDLQSDVGAAVGVLFNKQV